MGSNKALLAHVLEQMSQAGDMTAKAMFGGYCIYCDGKIVALFNDDQLFVKPTEAGKGFIEQSLSVAPKEVPAYSGASLYFLIDEQLEDADWMGQLIQITAQALPMPKPRPKKVKT